MQQHLAFFNNSFVFTLIPIASYFTGHPHFFMSWQVSAARVIHLLMIFCLTRTIKGRESSAFIFILNCVYRGWPNSALNMGCPVNPGDWDSCEGILPLMQWSFLPCTRKWIFLCLQKGGESSSFIAVKSYSSYGSAVNVLLILIQKPWLGPDTWFE